MSKLQGLYEKSVLAKSLARVTRKGLAPFNKGPDTLMQDRSPPARQSSLATHGLIIHLGHKRTWRGQMVMSALPLKAAAAVADRRLRYAIEAPTPVRIRGTMNLA
jgi:hypothetical protein